MDQFSRATTAICESGLPAPEADQSESSAPLRDAPRAGAHANAATSDTPAAPRHPLAAEAEQSAHPALARVPSAPRPPHAPFAPPSPAREHGCEVREDHPAPAPERAARSDGWTPERRVRFLEHLAMDGSVSGAARAVGLSPRAAYQLRARDGTFRLLWEAALELARPNLLDTLWSRAIDGIVEQVEREGADGAKTVTTRRRFDNRLAMSLLSHLDRRADVEAGKRNPEGARALAGQWDDMLDAVASGAPGDPVTRVVVKALLSPEDARIALKPLDRLAKPVLFGGHRVLRGHDGRVWTDLPAPDGWTGETTYRAAVLSDEALEEEEAEGIDRLDEDGEEIRPFRTLDPEEQAAWDAHEAADDALIAAMVAAPREEGLLDRGEWLDHIRARTAEAVANLAALEEAERRRSAGDAEPAGPPPPARPDCPAGPERAR